MICTRFAPSPTGYLHIGGLRTALYAYLYAKQNDGKFILRIEDTDKARSNVIYTQDIIDTMKLFNLIPDEIFTQSDRLDLYKEKAEYLVSIGHAYKEYTDDGLFTIKLNMQNIGDTIVYSDALRGDISWNTKELYDIVLIKSDGYPTYHLASVVDDNDMNITHIFRGEEWLSSTPYHVTLYKYFGWSIPEFIHLGLILNEDGTKLSKRHGDFSVQSLLNNNYIPSAILNYIALLGWHPSGDAEIFTFDKMLKLFSAKRIRPIASKFDKKKLRKFNLIHSRTEYGKQEFFNLHKNKTNEVLDIEYSIFITGVDIPVIIDYYSDKPEPLELIEFRYRLFKLIRNKIQNLSVAVLHLPIDIIDSVISDLSIMYSTKEINENIRLLLTGKTIGIPASKLLQLCEIDVLIDILY